MKLKQHLIIKQYFIDYSLGKYSDDEQPTVADYLVKVLEQPEYENELEITTLNKQPDGDISVIFESEKVLTEPQVYTRNIPNNSLMYLKKHIEASTYETIKDIPLEVNNELVITTEGGVKLSLLVDRDFKGKEEEEQKEILLDIFKRQVRIDFSEPEVIAGVTFDLDEDSSWDEDLNQLVIVSAVLKGRICVVDDTSRYELQDSHIGKLTHAGVDDTPPTYGNFKVKTTDGEILELDLTNVDQVEEWIEKNYISTIKSSSGGVIKAQLKVMLESVEEVISYGGPQIHTENGVLDINGYQLGTPNLIKIPDYLPEWVTNLNSFLKGASSFNQPLELDTSNVTIMRYFLYKASSFNQPLELDTSKVTDMLGFLSEATSFNQPLNLDTSNVTTMYLFLHEASSFNQPLNLDTSKVTNMSAFLQEATSFNQDLSHLCVPLITKKPANFDKGADAYTKPRPIWGTCPAG